jgi:Restriction endonuclease NaeI
MSLFDDSGYQPLSDSHIDYPDLAALERDLLAAVKGKELFEEKLRSFFRSAIDEVIDTARTGRYFLSELEKTEKTYLGTKFEILLRDWLQVPKGVRMDLLIGGQEVDVKSTTGGKSGWMIPLEAIGELLVLLRVNEDASTCAVGLVRARQEYLRSGENRDKKTSFSAEGTRHIWWMVQDFAYTPNFWTIVSKSDREEIMGVKGGSKRLAMLFERYQGVPLSRVQIQAIAAQDDFMKRIRSNQGARDLLRPRHIAILYSEIDRDLMHELGITCGYREFVSYHPQNDREAELLRGAGHLD